MGIALIGGAFLLGVLGVFAAVLIGNYQHARHRAHPRQMLQHVPPTALELAP